jgi:hypothetical protein
MGYNKKKIVVLLTWCDESSKKKLNQDMNSDRLSVAVVELW